MQSLRQLAGGVSMSTRRWRWQWVDGEVKWSAPDEGKFDIDLMEEWRADHPEMDDVDQLVFLLQHLFKVQFREDGETYRVSLVSAGSSEVVEPGRAAFEEWAKERERAVSWQNWPGMEGSWP
jgi:hypothetical protein